MSATIPTADDVRQIVREELARALGATGPDLLTTDQAAAEAGVRPKTIRAWVLAGRLRAQRRGRSLRILRADLDKCLGGDTLPAAALLSTLTKHSG